MKKNYESMSSVSQPVHIKAKRIEKNVLISDDRDMVKYMSCLLRNCKLASDSRGFLVYNGEYDGRPVTMASHGIGGSSCSVVVEELVMLGARKIVILGTAGIINEKVKVGDYVITTKGNHLPGGIYKAYKAERMVKAPDKRLTEKLIKTFTDSGLTVHTGSVFSDDAFYGEDGKFVKNRRNKGDIAVEMESATLFMLGKLRGIATAEVSIASNSVVDKAYPITSKALKEKYRRGAAAVFKALNS